MGKPALMLAAAMVLCRIPVIESAAAQNAPVPQTAQASSAYAANRILAYSAWDDDFLYLAFQVNKPTLKGTNAAPYSNPMEDDSIIVSIQRDNDKTATARTDQTYTFAASALGGVQLYSGAGAAPLFASFADISAQLEAVAKNEPDVKKQADKRAEILGRLLKFQATPKGFIRPTGSAVPGYTLEVGIPWGDIGGRPNAETKMGFSVVAQSLTPDSPAIQSFSPKIKTLADAANPSLWGEIVFRNALGTDAGGAVVAPRVLGAKPTIDGVLSDAEWNSTAAFEFGERASSAPNGGSVTLTIAARIKPEFTPKPARPAVPITIAPAPELSAHTPQKLAPMVLALYRMDFQGDTRRSTPAMNVLADDGRTLLSVHPLNGMGPWFSAERSDWHYRELKEVRRAGVDAVLALYRPAKNSRLAQNALNALATSLETLRSVGGDYPQVGLCLDTDAVLSTDREGRTNPVNALSRAIISFYRTIPAFGTFTVPLSPVNGGRRGNVVFFSGAVTLSPDDVSTLRKRFAQELPGRDLVLIADPASKDTAKLDAVFGETKADGFQFHSEGWIKIATVGAGYDAPNAPDIAKTFRSRKNDATYRADWQAALAKSPDWILLDGWNDYADGAAIAPTMEYGTAFADLTKVYTRLWAGKEKLAVKFLAHDTPQTLTGGQSYQVMVRAQNTGGVIWGSAAPEYESVGFAYRWRKGAQVLTTGKPVPLTNAVLAGQGVSSLLPIRALDGSGKPLADGEYLLEIGAVTTDKGGKLNGWVGSFANGSALQIPVKIGAELAFKATLLASDLPRSLESGSVTEARITLRNDGGSNWNKADGVRVGVRFYAATASPSVEPAPESLIDTADASAEIPNDVAPGDVVTVRVPIPAMMSDGKPLPVSDTVQYSVRYEVSTAKTGGTQTIALQEATASGVTFAPMPVTIVDFDFGARFLTDGTPNSLPIARRLPVRISLQNTGTQTWKKEGVRVGYHWYYQDGTEVIWDDETTPLPKDMLPGEKVTEMLAWVSAPPYDGTYYLVWDVKVGNTWASTTDGSRAFGESVREVQVTGGKLAFADLSKHYNLDGITEDSNRTDGNFDGKGNTFPALLLPPYANAQTAPATIWLPTSKTGPDSPRRISFRMASKEPKTPNFIECRGQRIDLGKTGATCRVLHILAANTGKEGFTNLKLIFQEAMGEAQDLTSLKIERWDTLPVNPDNLGFAVPQRHTREGIEQKPSYLHHYILKMREGRKLIAIQLPVLPDVKIAAITMEK